jgi:tetratricopeptide (TPR) repeat protein
MFVLKKALFRGILSRNTFDCVPTQNFLLVHRQRNFFCLSSGQRSLVSLRRAKKKTNLCSLTFLQQRKISVGSPEGTSEFTFHMQLAAEYADKEKWKDALKEFTVAHELFPRHFRPLIHMAAINERLLNYDEAIDCSRRAIQYLHPTSKMDRIILANEYARMGRCYQAKAEYWNAYKAFLESFAHHSNTTVANCLRNIEAILKTTTVIHNNSENGIENDEFYQKLCSTLEVELKTSPGRGRGLFAKRDFAEGEPLFVDFPVCSFVEMDNSVEDYCHYCLRPLVEPTFVIAHPLAEQMMLKISDSEINKMKRTILNSFNLDLETQSECSNCRMVKYCSDICRDLAWKNFHKFFCELFKSKDPRMVFLFPGIFSDVVTRKFFPLNSGEYVRGEMMAHLLCILHETPELWTSILKKMAWIEKTPPPPLLDHEIKQIEILCELFPSQKEFIQANFQRLKSIINLNSFSIRVHTIKILLDADPEAMEMGKEQLETHIQVDETHQVHAAAMYRLASFLNHSCEPNVALGLPCTSHIVSWTALRPIKRGEELQTNYVFGHDLENDVQKRRQLLFEHYGFWCDCSLCQKQMKNEK